jgi:hypothetical protein
MITGLRAEIWTRDLSNKKQDHDVFGENHIKPVNT